MSNAVTIGEVFTYNHYPERLTAEQKQRIEAQFLAAPEDRQAHQDRLQRDAERDAARSEFIRKLKSKSPS